MKFIGTVWAGISWADTGRRCAVYLVGCVAFSVGASFFIRSGLGTDPLDTFSLGVLNYLPLTVGICQAVVAAVCIGVWAVLTRRRPPVSPFVTFFLCGSLIDVLRWSDFAGRLGVGRYVLLLAGSGLCAYASALIIMSGFGIRAIDLLAIGVRGLWRWPFWCGKGLVEGALLLSGWLLGGPVGIGTVSFLVCVDLLIEPCVRFNRRFLAMRDRGFFVRAGEGRGVVAA